MKKLYQHHQGLEEEIIMKGFSHLDSTQLMLMLEGMLDRRVQRFDYRSLLENQVPHHTAFMLSICYELGRRDFENNAKKF